MDKLILRFLPEADLEELMYIETLTAEMDDEELENFLIRYRSRRRKQEMVVILCALGFVGFSGLHRIFLNQIFMGVIYFFTAGFCFIGTIVDLINHRQLIREYNRRVAIELLDDHYEYYS